MDVSIVTASDADCAEILNLLHGLLSASESSHPRPLEFDDAVWLEQVRKGFDFIRLAGHLDNHAVT